MNITIKGVIMNNLKKLGLTALAGSLVAVSAQAGEMSVSGHATATLKVGKTDNAARTLGHNTGVSFSGSGEMDNGWTFSTFAAMKDAMATLSSSAMTLTMGSLGTIGVSKGGGFNVNGGFDEEVPTAYEQISDAGGDAGFGTSANYVGAFADDNALIYKFPTLEFSGATVDIGYEHAMTGDTTTQSDGGSVAQSGTFEGGHGLGVKVGYDALTLGVYGAERERRNSAGTTGVKDEFHGSWFAKYSMGPVSVGYSQSYVDAGVQVASDYTTDAAKVLGTNGGIWEMDQISIAFNVNDDLSISYTEGEDTYDAQATIAGTTTADVTQDMDSIQIAYSMGAMSIKAYSTEITNPGYDEDAATRNVHEIAIGLAF